MAHTLTRRALVAASPAAVVASMPVLVANAQAAARPDEELMQFAVDFERLHDEWQDLLDETDDLERAYQGASGDIRRGRKKADLDAVASKADDKVRELDVLAARMRAMPAQTVRGLAIKARLTQFDSNLSRRSEMQGPERDWDWDVRCMEHFVRELQRFADLATTGGLHA